MNDSNVFGDNNVGNTIAWIATMARRLWFAYHAFQGYKKLFGGRWYEVRISQWIAMAWMTIFWGALIIGIFYLGGWDAAGFIWVPLVGYLLYRLYVVVERARINAAIRHGGIPIRPEDSLVERLTGFDGFNQPLLRTGYRRLEEWERTPFGRESHAFWEDFHQRAREADARNGVPSLEYLHGDDTNGIAPLEGDSTAYRMRPWWER